MTAGSLQNAIRDASSSDLDFLRRMLFEAWLWDPHADRPDYEDWRRTTANLNDPYLVDFGKALSDIGVIAEQDGRPVGAAWIRAFSNETAQRGFLGEDIPELAIAVDQRFRGRGLGRRLLLALIARARSAGAPGISLHVNRRNVKALRLYRSIGFVEQKADDVGPVMFLPLAPRKGAPLAAAREWTNHAIPGADSEAPAPRRH